MPTCILCCLTIHTHEELDYIDASPAAFAAHVGCLIGLDAFDEDALPWEDSCGLAIMEAS